MMMRTPQNVTETYRHEIERQVLLLNCVFWLAFFTSMSLRGLATGEVVTIWLVLARASIAVSGFGACYGLHAIFRRHMPEKPRARFIRAAELGFAASLVVTLVFVIAYTLVENEAWDKRWASLAMTQTWFFPFTSHLWILLGWTAIYSVLINSAELRERDRRLAAAERAAQQAQLAALRLQIHPHFLFNALNALAGLVTLGRRQDAEEMIHNLSAFLRRTLTTNPDHMSSLRSEVDMQMTYLGIERTRYCDRLKIVCDVPEDCRDVAVPNLILQPLVENVIKHALAPSETLITLEIGAARRGDNLEVWIKDDGVSTGPVNPGLGIGLRNVAERLRALYGGAGNLAVGREDGCWISRITIPFKSDRPCVS